MELEEQKKKKRKTTQNSAKQHSNKESLKKKTDHKSSFKSVEDTNRLYFKGEVSNEGNTNQKNNVF